MVNAPMPGQQRKDFPVVPPGQQRLVIADVVDKGEVPTPYGPKLKVDLIAFSEHEVNGERPSLVARHTNSLSEKANLRKFLRSIRGHDILPSEGRNGPDGRPVFDLDSVIGTTFYANIVHKKTPHKTYANIESAMPLPPGMDALSVPEGFTRFKDRQAAKKMEEAFDDQDVPF